MGVGTTQTRNHTKSQCPDSVGRTSLTKHREIENKRKDFRSGCKERKERKKRFLPCCINVRLEPFDKVTIT